MASSYSFKDVIAIIRGPNGMIEVGSQSGAADEGISTEQIEDKASMLVGAGGQAMHSLHASNAGRMTIRLLKTSPINALLSDMADADFASAAVYGQNQITLRDVVRGDVLVATGCGFVRKPNNAWSKDGNIIEWQWNCEAIEQQFGSGNPAVT